MSLLSQYASHSHHTASRAADHGATITDVCRLIDVSDGSTYVFLQDQALKQAMTELRTLLERFANGQSLDIIFDAFNALVDDADRDKELKDWFSEVQTYARKARLTFLLERHQI